MKKLKLWEAWRTAESDEKDKDNIAELNDFLLEMKDELDYFEHKIDVDSMLEDCYNIKYHIVCGFGFSVDNRYGTDNLEEMIESDKSYLELFNRYMNQSYQLLERLKRTNYKIAYFSVEHTWKGNDKIVVCNIRIQKMD